MKEQLNERQQQVTTRLGIRKTAKLIRITNNIRNSVCDDCRQKFDQAKAQLDLQDYCIKCQIKVKPKLDKIKRL